MVLAKVFQQKICAKTGVESKVKEDGCLVVVACAAIEFRNKSVVESILATSQKSRRCIEVVSRGSSESNNQYAKQ